MPTRITAVRSPPNASHEGLLQAHTAQQRSSHSTLPPPPPRLRKMYTRTFSSAAFLCTPSYRHSAPHSECLPCCFFCCQQSAPSDLCPPGSITLQQPHPQTQPTTRPLSYSPLLSSFSIVRFFFPRFPGRWTAFHPRVLSCWVSSYVGVCERSRLCLHLHFWVFRPLTPPTATHPHRNHHFQTTGPT